MASLLRDWGTNTPVSGYHPLLSLCLVMMDMLINDGYVNERYINEECWSQIFSLWYRSNMGSHKYSYTTGNVIFFTFNMDLLQRTFSPPSPFFFFFNLFENTFCPTSEVTQGSWGKFQPQVNQTVPDMGLPGGLNLCSGIFAYLSI